MPALPGNTLGVDPGSRVRGDPKVILLVTFVDWIKTRLNAFSPRPRANPTSKDIFQFDYHEIARNFSLNTFQFDYYEIVCTICNTTSVNLFQYDYDEIGCNSSSLNHIF